MSKRKRLLWLTAGLGALAVAGISSTIWLFSQPTETYRPGEQVEGIVSSLARDIPPDYPRVTFVDVSEEARIIFRHFSGRRSTQLPEDMGSGAAWGDYDNDGWMDLYVANIAGPLTMTPEERAVSPAHCALYHNNGDGTFSEVSHAAGVDYRGWANAAAWGDYDNDGWLDLLVTTFGVNVLYRNNGDGTFADVSDPAGIAGYQGFWAGASWADYNGDGWLDFYVCGYVRYTPLQQDSVLLQYNVEVPASLNPSSFPPERNLLFQNQGDGTFREVALAAGVANSEGRSLSATWCDFNEDGRPDLYVANDVSDNTFYLNSGDGTFADISHEAWVADYRGAMGIAVGDWDRDQDLDLFITHWIAQENALYNNLRSQVTALDVETQTPVRFMDEADRFGLGQIALDYIGWGTSFIDYDNDGWLDLFVVNGSTFQQDENPELLEPMQDQLFWNSGPDNGFYDVAPVSGAVFQAKSVGRGAAFADYDNDGDVDIFIVNHGGRAQLLRNDGGNRRNWAQIKLLAADKNRFAIGARLRIVTGSAVQLRQIGIQPSYCSQNSFIEHIGLGTMTQIDTVEVIWPDGTRSVHANLPANALHTLSQPTSR